MTPQPPPPAVAVTPDAHSVVSTARGTLKFTKISVLFIVGCGFWAFAYFLSPYWLASPEGGGGIAGVADMSLGNPAMVQMRINEKTPFIPSSAYKLTPSQPLPAPVAPTSKP